MARADSKTVRFAKIVERSGEPHAHTLWLPPGQDPELKRAIAGHRVMTIQRGSSGHTDMGVVGFDAKRTRDAQFLIFPKSLKSFEGARVVGIKFDLVEQPKFATPRELKASLAAGRPKRAKGKRLAQSVPAAARAEVEIPEEPEKPEPRAEKEQKRVAFQPEPTPAASAPPRAAPRKSRKPPQSARAADTALIREVRAALKELKAGKTVAAYHRLERALEP